MRVHITPPPKYRGQSLRPYESALSQKRVFWEEHFRRDENSYIDGVAKALVDSFSRYLDLVAARSGPGKGFKLDRLYQMAMSMLLERMDGMPIDHAAVMAFSSEVAKFEQGPLVTECVGVFLSALINIADGEDANIVVRGKPPFVCYRCNKRRVYVMGEAGDNFAYDVGENTTILLNGTAGDHTAHGLPRSSWLIVQGGVESFCGTMRGGVRIGNRVARMPEEPKNLQDGIIYFNITTPLGDTVIPIKIDDKHK